MARAASGRDTAASALVGVDADRQVHEHRPVVVVHLAAEPGDGELTEGAGLVEVDHALLEQLDAGTPATAVAAPDLLHDDGPLDPGPEPAADPGAGGDAPEGAEPDPGDG